MTGPAPSSSGGTAGSVSAQPAHIVVVMMENHSYADIVGNPGAPYLNDLAKQGISLTRMYAIAHPSEPNYVALFSGSTQGVVDDTCPVTLTADNLGHQLRVAGLTFSAYSEGLPNVGNKTCAVGAYVRRHAPWTDFTDLPALVGQPFTNFPADYSRLPTVSFVVPDLQDDMHDGTIAQGDSWLRAHLSGYASWAASHRSLLIVTWDEDDRSAANQIPTFVVGAGVRASQVGRHLTLYSLLRLIESRYGLPLLGRAATAPVLDVGPVPK